MFQPQPGGEDATGIDAVAVAEWLVDRAPAYINLINDSYELVTFTETLDGTGQGQRVSAGSEPYSGSGRHRPGPARELRLAKSASGRLC